MRIYTMNIIFDNKEETIVCEMTVLGVIVLFRDRRIHFNKFGKNIKKQIIENIMLKEKQIKFSK